MKFRRARTLVMTYYTGQFAVHNFLTKSRFTCSADALDFLSRLESWHTAEQVLGYFPEADSKSIAAQISNFVEMDAVVVEGTALADLDGQFRDQWQWGMVGGYYHFATRNTLLPSEADGLKLLMQRTASGQKPPEYHRANPAGPDTTGLPPVDRSRPLQHLLSRRRSIRQYSGESIDLGSLGNCLYAGNGLVSFRVDPVLGRLPLMTSPSLGGTNPYELYVYAARVDGLKPGFYHYGAEGHDLARAGVEQVDIVAMCGDQPWISAAGAVILLAANFARSAWRFHLAVAYRSVLMGAGFIGQNIGLMATELGLSAVPIGSLRHALIESSLGIPPIENAIVLGLALGKPRSVQAQPAETQP